MKKISVLVLLFSLLAGCSDENRMISYSGATMGTTYSVKIDPAGKEADEDILQAKTDSLLKNVNMQMSTYIPESEISRFNSSSDTGWFDISSDFARVLVVSREISEKSEGAFDITIGPLINLWGFGIENTGDTIPSDEAVLARKVLTGYEHLQIDTVNNRIKKEIPGLQISLSAVAKGFGVDKTGELLENLGFDNYMVEIGGEVRTRGFAPGENEWKIGISTPDNNFGVQKVLHLSDISVATSGDYHNYFEKEGHRYSHTIDPGTGKPITHNLASVTVLHASCMYADAYATAIDVLGPEKGFVFAAENGLEIFMLKKENGEFTEAQTAGMKDYLVTYENGEAK